METNKILPQAALSQTLSRITQHVDNDHLYPLVRAICNSYEAPHRMTMLEVIMVFRVSNAIADISEGQAEREILAMASRNSNHTLGSLFWFLSEYLTTLSDAEREAFEISSIDAPKQNYKTPKTLEEKLELVREQINAAALGCKFKGQAFENYDTARFLTETGHERAVNPLTHPYVMGKFTPYRCYADFTSLYIPIVNSGLQVVGCQTINPRLTPQKRHNKGLKLAGNFSYVGDLIDGKFPNLILIAEGWKTACVLFEATGIFVVIAHGCGNFSTTLVIIAERVGCFSEVKSVLICGDIGTEAKVLEARQLAWLSSELPTGAVFPDSDVANFDFADQAELDGIESLRAAFGEVLEVAA